MDTVLGAFPMRFFWVDDDGDARGACWMDAPFAQRSTIRFFFLGRWNSSFGLSAVV